jgi:hypothetical protein
MNEIAVELTAYPKFRKAELIVKIGFMKFTPPPFTNKLFINLTRRFFFLETPVQDGWHKQSGFRNSHDELLRFGEDLLATLHTQIRLLIRNDPHERSRPYERHRGRVTGATS